MPGAVFTPDGDGVVDVALPVDLVGADGVAVTVEPAGGSEQPTTTPVMSGVLV